MKPMTAQEKIEFDLAIKIGLPKYFVFEDGKITRRKQITEKQFKEAKARIDKLFEKGDMKKIKKVKEALQITMKFCEQCKMITRHRDDNCITCESDYYANNYDEEK